MHCSSVMCQWRCVRKYQLLREKHTGSFCVETNFINKLSSRASIDFVLSIIEIIFSRGDASSGPLVWVSCPRYHQR